MKGPATVSRSRYVLDSYAILAFLQQEAGWARTKELLQAAASGDIELHMSAINLAEVQYLITRRGRDVPQRLAALESLPLKVASADAYLPQIVDLKAKYPLSLADCFAAALALDLNCPLVTGDPEFHLLESVITVEWLG